MTADSSAAFLTGRDGRTWESDRIDRPATYHLGDGPSQLEVADIEVVVADGFGLSRAELEGVLDYFSEKACPADMRHKISTRVGR